MQCTMPIARGIVYDVTYTEYTMIIYSLLGKQKQNKQKYERQNKYKSIPTSTW